MIVATCLPDVASNLYCQYDQNKRIRFLALWEGGGGGGAHAPGPEIRNKSSPLINQYCACYEKFKMTAVLSLSYETIVELHNYV